MRLLGRSCSSNAKTFRRRARSKSAAQPIRFFRSPRKRWREAWSPIPPGTMRRRWRMRRGSAARAEAAARIERETGAVMVHPYDDDRIIAGQATAAKELLEEIADLDAVLAPVSGGGLLSGTALAAKHIRPEIRVIGCEPEKADDAYRSMTTGRLQTIEKSDTIADGLRAGLAPRTFDILRRNVDAIILVSEEEIIAAMRMVWERMKILVEPSSAVPVAPLLRPGGVAALAIPSKNAGDVQRIGIILSGGNVDLAALPFSR